MDDPGATRAASPPQHVHDSRDASPTAAAPTAAGAAAPAPPGRLSAAFAVAALLEGMSVSLILFFTPLYVRTALGEERVFVLSLIVSVHALASFAAANFWGAVMDRAGRLRPFLVTGVAGHAATLLVLAFLREPRLVPVVVAVGALFSGSLKTAYLAAATLRRETSRGSALGQMMLWQSLGWTVASTLAGIVTGRAGDGALRAVLAFTALCGLVLIAGARRFVPDERFAERSRRTAGFVSSIREDLVSLYRSPALATVVLVVLAVFAANWAWMSVMSLILTEELGGARWMLGAALAVSALAGIACFPVAGRWADKHGGKAPFVLSTAAYVAEFLVLALVRDPIVVALVFIVPLYPFFQVGTGAIVAEHSRRAQRAGGLGILTGAQSLASGAGAILGGVVADGAGFPAVPRVSLAISVVGLAVVLERVLRARVLTKVDSALSDRQRD